MNTHPIFVARENATNLVQGQNSKRIQVRPIPRFAAHTNSVGALSVLQPPPSITHQPEHSSVPPTLRRDLRHEDATMASEPRHSSLAYLATSASTRDVRSAPSWQALPRNGKTREQLWQLYIRMPHELVDEAATVLLVLDAHDLDGCRSWLAVFARAGGTRGLCSCPTRSVRTIRLHALSISRIIR